MKKLRLLKLNYVELTGEYKYLSRKLRWLCWHGFPLKIISNDFDQQNLVAMDLRYSNLRHVWKDAEGHLSNKDFNLEGGDFIEVCVAFGSGHRVKKIGVSLLWDKFIYDTDSFIACKSVPYAYILRDDEDDDEEYDEDDNEDDEDEEEEEEEDDDDDYDDGDEDDDEDGDDDHEPEIKYLEHKSELMCCLVHKSYVREGSEFPEFLRGMDNCVLLVDGYSFHVHVEETWDEMLNDLCDAFNDLGNEE
ncbi:F-BOX WITH WD-40 2 [Prunus dulcis]|uniref:F-BOX WITH WD-40 2 n=1 Tax=Prunus dulcis TaxID=3755 RepID=A0A4Y1QVL0_PRUDU|nr:F-BOX WITH WD-40 2 [Prunus dulcis]